MDFDQICVKMILALSCFKIKSKYTRQDGHQTITKNNRQENDDISETVG